MAIRYAYLGLVTVAWLTCFSLSHAADATTAVESLGVDRGILVLVGEVDRQFVIELAKPKKWIIYCQTFQEQEADEIRRAADAVGLLGSSIYVEAGDPGRLPLADNVADGAIAFLSQIDQQRCKTELLRVVHPLAKVMINSDPFSKPVPTGYDNWSHPYHGPDNNPQSTDQVARAPYRTQFLSEPWYGPIPEVTVAAGGRVFKAFGHIALKQREWPLLNRLIAINGYNGTRLWDFPLRPGFMIHRNTLIATHDRVFLGDDISCKVLAAATGKMIDEIHIPPEIDPDGVWKWMGMDDGRLYAIVGSTEKQEPTVRTARTQWGWPWTGLGKGYAGEYRWGFGRTLVAIDLMTKKVLWVYRSDHPIDSRASCMADGRIFIFSQGNYLAAVEKDSGRELWKTRDSEILNAIGQDDRAQTPPKGFSSSCYAKANDKAIYFAGPQRTQLVSVSAEDGKLLWTYPHGNFRLIFRDDGLYAMGREQTSKKFDYLSGRVLADLGCYRGNCTRATGSIDSIFTRGYRHTGTMRLDVATGQPLRNAAMRPGCQDGVIVSNGLLYFGPWICDCNHSLHGLICLAPADTLDLQLATHANDRRELTAESTVDSSKFANQPSDADTGAGQTEWDRYRASADRCGGLDVELQFPMHTSWTNRSRTNTKVVGVELTAPVISDGALFWSGKDGIVRAADNQTGRPRWRAYTGGSVWFPPELWAGRVYVGSGDGYVYCLDAKTGHRIWRFRAAPAERRIPVYGQLLSTWPVGSGILVDNGVVYAAAGISSADGTFVYAIDALTGQVKWQNSTSGHLQQQTGVSVQGHLLIHNHKLFLAGGNVVSPAVYDLDSGTCLNELGNAWWKRPAGSNETFPSHPKPTMFHRSPRGRELFVVDDEVRAFDQLLYSAPGNGSSRYFGGHFLQAELGDVLIRAKQGQVARLAPHESAPQESRDEKIPPSTGEAPGAHRKTVGLWTSDLFRNPIAMAVCRNAVVVCGERSQKHSQTDSTSPSTFVISAMSIEDGHEIWSKPLPGEPVAWGLAVGRDGDLFLTLQNGQVIAFETIRE